MRAVKMVQPPVAPSRDLDFVYDLDGQPMTAILSVEAWNELSPHIRETMPAGWRRRGGEPVEAYIQWSVYQGLAEEIEDAVDALAFDRADLNYRSQRIVEKIEGIMPAVPLEVVKAIDAGVAPIAAWRKFRGLRQSELAAKSGLERSYISHLEGGTRQGTPEVLLRIANVLGCLIEDLIPATAKL
jgi:DNA-binding Xre family transcriptional regulator